MRLPIDTFEFPLAEIRRGYRSAIYFNRTKTILEREEPKSAVMQVFQKNDAVLCGMDEVLALLQQCVGHWSDTEEAHGIFDDYMHAKLEARRNPLDIEAATLVVRLEQILDGMWINTYDGLTVEALCDGDTISPWEPVLKISGNYSSFAHLESVYLGILARATKVATNTAAVCDAAGNKDVLFFADRFDRWSNQGADGYAAYIGGAKGIASEAMGAWWGAEALGTMPHALIAMYGGNVAVATEVFHKNFPDTKCVALVDFNNDCVEDAYACAMDLGDMLWGVRLDTSENMVDYSVPDLPEYGSFKPNGVNVPLVFAVRRMFDRNGFRHVKIIVSGGFNPEKIKAFEAQDAPVDAYAVGSSLLQGNNDFTADIVRPKAKLGRMERHSDRLNVVKR